MLPMKRLNILSRDIIGCAIKVHRALGPGLLESIYEDALCIELSRSKLSYARQVPVPVIYDGHVLNAPLKLDIIVANEIILEIKAIDQLHPVHEAQLVSYLRLAGKQLGLLINFNTV